MWFAVCFILLHFASILLPRALLGAGVALGALFLEQLSCKLAPKIVKNQNKINGFCCVLHFASMLLPRALLGAGVAFLALFLEQSSRKLAPNIIKTQLEMYDLCCLLHFASFCFHASSKSSPRGWRGFLGSLLEQCSCNSASMFWLILPWLPSESPRLQDAP